MQRQKPAAMARDKGGKDQVGRGTTAISRRGKRERAVEIGVAAAMAKRHHAIRTPEAITRLGWMGQRQGVRENMPEKQMEVR